jgi:hypothetical protein
MPRVVSLKLVALLQGTSLLLCVNLY